MLSAFNKFYILNSEERSVRVGQWKGCSEFVCAIMTAIFFREKRSFTTKKE